ncbi:hypothetical protein QWM81_28035 [Streptomyces ficellus]|uniref:Uncharacterized protein n=1 Tax=Streptomyces ficellus TaxID=1977088 RepID=A0ABT7ZFL5_9ACTN|nr:hypothetical protein [Streptomyces ficellus]MDN3297821.1 hypothetical protein [Streptomyces ficellus]
MSARTSTGTHTLTPARTHVTTSADAAHVGGARLPWWAVALPVAAFVVLLGLITGCGEAHAVGGDPAVGRILQRIQQTLAP